MDWQRNGMSAIVFDYGNTLIEFSTEQIEACDLALARTLERVFGSVDEQQLRIIRSMDRRAAYAGEYREQSLVDISTAMVRRLYHCEPDAAALEAILQARFDSFVEAITAPDYLHELLDTLSQRYRLGLLSNYPDGEAIRATLERLDLEKYFQAVVVSGDVGHVKPHPLPFQTVLDRLGVGPEEAVYVGDNWLGDIQGAKQVGMAAVYTLQYDTPEKFDRREGDHEPDLTIRHLTELLDHL